MGNIHPAEQRRDPAPGIRFPFEGEEEMDHEVRYLDSLAHNNMEIKICYSVFWLARFPHRMPTDVRVPEGIPFPGRLTASQASLRGP